MTLSKFVKVYNNLPLGERNLACCVIDGEGVSWKLAYEEIKEDTEIGKAIQLELEKLKLI